MHGDEAGVVLWCRLCGADGFAGFLGEELVCLLDGLCGALEESLFVDEDADGLDWLEWAAVDGDDSFCDELWRAA